MRERSAVGTRAPGCGSGVDDAQQQIHHHVDQQDGPAEEQDHRLSQLVVLRDHGPDHRRPESRPREHVLHEHRAPDQAGHQQAAEGQRRREHVRQRVAHVLKTRRQPLAPGRAHVVLAEDVERLGADDA
jgi:hypothetical protein